MNNELQPKRNSIFYIKRIFGAILLLALAAVFLFSAYSKVYSNNAFDAFQWSFLNLGINSITLAGIFARLFIGFEAMLGIFLLCHIFLKGFTYPAIITLLVIFIIYLVIVLVQQGNTGSCGCFGDKIQMKPLSSIGKNVLMIAATILLIYIYPIKTYKNQEWIAAVIGMAALVTPFILIPLDANNEPEAVYRSIDLNPLYKATPSPSVELRQGKHIVAFMSLTCPHCKKAAYLLQIIYHQHPNIPIFLVLNGPASEEHNFFKDTHAQDVPHLIFKNLSDFMAMAGPTVPAIYWINNGTIERQSTYYQLDPKYMQQWLKH